jgi:RNA polymerase sigma-70 factor (ECF subfamily)
MRDPDAELVARIGRGDQAAATALVRRHMARMLALARRMIGNPHDAEEIAQEVFVRAWREAHKWREGGAKFETWMHRVALNLCYDRLRKRREINDPDAGLSVADTGVSAPDQILERQRRAVVSAAIDALPERQKAALILCHYQDMTNGEAAAALEVSVEALESLLARARRALKAALADVAQDLMSGAEGHAS